MMNVRAIPVLFVVAGLLLLTVVMIREPDVQSAAGAQDGSDELSSDGGQRGRGVTAARDQNALPAGDLNALLEARVERLERVIQRLDQAQDLEELRTRVEALERSMRSSRPSTTNVTTRSQSNDVSQLKSQYASLKRAHEQLASKVASDRNKSYPQRNDLRVLQQKVFSLQNTVQRLESKR